MCRLFATTVGFDSVFTRNEILDRMMLLAAAESYQRDGWGLTDGKQLYRGVGVYGFDDEWQKDFEGDIAVAHVRAASDGMGMSKKESHPYNLGSFLFAHNGQFYGTASKYTSSHAPNTDSYRAAAIFEEKFGAKFTPDNVNEWLGDFWRGTAFAWMALVKNQLYFARNELRTLYYLPIPQQIGVEKPGYIICTSQTVLEGVRQYLKLWYTIETKDIAPVAAKALHTIEYGSLDMNVAALNYSLQGVPRLWQLKNELHKRTRWIEKPRS